MGFVGEIGVNFAFYNFYEVSIAGIPGIGSGLPQALINARSLSITKDKVNGVKRFLSLFHHYSKSQTQRRKLKKILEYRASATPLLINKKVLERALEIMFYL